MLWGGRCCAEARKLVQADTTHPENPAYGGSVNADGSPSSTLAEDADATCRKIAFRRLSIVRAPPPEPDAAEGWVTFQVREQQAKALKCIACPLAATSQGSAPCMCRSRSGDGLDDQKARHLSWTLGNPKSKLSQHYIFYPW